MESGSKTFELTVYYDGLCPICRREIEWIRRRDKTQNLNLIDFAAPGFDADEAGIPESELTAQIHARTPDGKILRGVEVFRQMYNTIGLGWLLGWTMWPVGRPLANAAYRMFAAIRPHLSSYRADPEDCARCTAG